jgi:hypothetical protein
MERVMDFEAVMLAARQCSTIIARSKKRGGPVFTCKEPAQPDSDICLTCAIRALGETRRRT